MSAGYKISHQHAVHYMTFQVVYWIDIFSRKIYRDIILDSFRFCQRHKGLKVHAYVIMSNHVHCILSSQKPTLVRWSKSLKHILANKSKKQFTMKVKAGVNGCCGCLNVLPASTSEMLIFNCGRMKTNRKN